MQSPANVSVSVPSDVFCGGSVGGSVDGSSYMICAAVTAAVAGSVGATGTEAVRGCDVSSKTAITIRSNATNSDVPMMILRLRSTI